MGRTDTVAAVGNRAFVALAHFLIGDTKDGRRCHSGGGSTETCELRFLCDVEGVRAGDGDDRRIAGFSRTEDGRCIRGNGRHNVRQRLTDDEHILPDLQFVIEQRAGAGDDTTSTTRSDRRNRDRAGVGALFILVSPSRHSVTPSLKLNGIYDADTAALLGAVAFVWASRAFVSTSRTLAAINSVA